MSFASPTIESPPPQASPQQNGRWEPAAEAVELVGPKGRLFCPALSQADRNYAVIMHISLFAMLVIPPFGCAIPVILWLIRKQHSTFIYDHGRELSNVAITCLILTVVLGMIPIAGWLALAVWYIVTAISAIRGALATGRAEYFRYPMTFRFLA